MLYTLFNKGMQVTEHMNRAPKVATMMNERIRLAPVHVSMNVRLQVAQQKRDNLRFFARTELKST
jgi:hypothetical protein